MHPTKFYVAPIVHKDTRCDECHATPIEGRRYKCLQCENYDLCTACYERVCHIPGHVFASLKKPTFGLPWAGSLLSGPVGPWGAQRTSSVFGGASLSRRPPRNSTSPSTCLKRKCAPSRAARRRRPRPDRRISPIRAPFTSRANEGLPSTIRAIGSSALQWTSECINLGHFALFSTKSSLLKS